MNAITNSLAAANQEDFQSQEQPQAQPHEGGQRQSLIEVASGHTLNLNDPDPADILIDDIARSLSQLPRYIGHAQSGQQPFTQAIHALWVAQYLMRRTANPTLALQGMLRNAYKAYIGDIPKPTMDAIATGPDIRALEERVQTAIYHALDVPSLSVAHADVIYQAQQQAKRTEAEALIPSSGKHWQLPPLDGTAKTIGFIEPVEPWIAEQAYRGYIQNLTTQGHL